LPRRIPSRAECLDGIPIILDNAEAHLAAADVLVEAGHVGFAIAHLVLAIEESEKARTLDKVVLGDPVPEADLRAVLYQHPARHKGALGKSWTSGAISLLVDFEKEGLWQKLGRSPLQVEQSRWEETISRHPELLPRDWDNTAGPLREHSLYVDLVDGGWTSPGDTAKAEFDRLRPAVARQLVYVRTAYLREIHSSGSGPPWSDNWTKL